MKETFEDYLQRLKDRRTEDDYKYTDEDFIQYEEYITDCWLTNLSVYKCLEFMYFAEKDMDDQLFNREPKRETLEEAVERFCPYVEYEEEWVIDQQRSSFIEGAKWYQEQHDLLPGFIKQFDPKEGEINGEEWTAVHFLKWLELNKFKIVK